MEKCTITFEIILYKHEKKMHTLITMYILTQEKSLMQSFLSS